jgi:CHAD domain-containing protein
VPKRTFGRFARAVVRKRLQRILEDGTVAFARGRRSELHALRIAVKRLRYNIEFAASLATGDVRAPLHLLAQLQERLGALADADGCVRTYETLLDGLAESDPRRIGLIALRDTISADRTRQLAEARAFWTLDPPYPERLAASISAAFDSGSPKPEP